MSFIDSDPWNCLILRIEETDTQPPAGAGTAHWECWSCGADGERSDNKWPLNTPVHTLLEKHRNHLSESHRIKPVPRCKFIFHGARCVKDTHPSAEDHELRVP